MHCAAANVTDMLIHEQAGFKLCSASVAKGIMGINANMSITAGESLQLLLSEVMPFRVACDILRLHYIFILIIRVAPSDCFLFSVGISGEGLRFQQGR